MKAGKPLKPVVEEVIEEDNDEIIEENDDDFKMPGENDSEDLNYEKDSLYEKQNSFVNEDQVVLEDYTAVGTNAKTNILKKAHKGIYDDYAIVPEEEGGKEKFNFIQKQAEEMSKEMLKKSRANFLPIESFTDKYGQVHSHEEPNLPFETVDVAS